MATAAEITEVAKVAHDAGLSSSVQMVLVILLLVILVSAPVILLLRDMRKNGKVSANEEKASDIQTGLYDHLHEQVKILTARLDDTHAEFNKAVRENAAVQSELRAENSQLKARVTALESCEEMVKKLQSRLDQKDTIIIERDTQLNTLFMDLRMRDQKIIELQERIHQLEVRLAADEARFPR